MSQVPEFTLAELTGRARTHLAELQDPSVHLHKDILVPFQALRAAAMADGIDLVAFSGFRDFERQLAIWNGERPMQDRDGAPLDALSLPPARRVEAICWWSALPGASRHHWGTDFDVMDRAALPAGRKFQVVPAEYGPAGPFARLTTWLDAHMHAFGFFRPYDTDRGGVRPEPWHLSHAAVAARAVRALDPAVLREVLAAAELDGKEEVLAGLDAHFASYVVNVDPAPEVALCCPRLV
jgi:LAS superfamily LD-carboxypeptidase LdcB